MFIKSIKLDKPLQLNEGEYFLMDWQSSTIFLIGRKGNVIDETTFTLE